LIVFLSNKEFMISFLSGHFVFKGFCPFLFFPIITGDYGDALLDHPLSTSCDGMVNKVLTK